MENNTSKNEEIRANLLKPSLSTKIDKFGRLITLFFTLIIVLIVTSIIFFIFIKGTNTFLKDGISLKNFFTSTNWNPSEVGSDGKPNFGSLPMIVTSFLVTVISALFATPFSIATAVYMTEISPKKGAKIMQPVIELLVGIPSVVYGFLGLMFVVPFIRNIFGGSGFGILSASIVLFVMILPTITSMIIDTLNSLPKNYRESALSIGATRWQMIYKVLLRSATPGILTAIVFGMARAFGEALAVQMVIGNSSIMPTNLTSSSATLTSVLTQGMGNTILGTVQNDALWTLSLILLIMSLGFNLAIKMIGKLRKSKK